jgi:hypothetical protein
MRPDNTVSSAQRGSSPLPSSAAKQKASRAAGGPSKKQAVSYREMDRTTAANRAPKSGTPMRPTSSPSKRAGQAKTVQTGIMSKNRAVRGAMSYMGNPAAKPAKPSMLARQNAMSKNRAVRGKMGR